MKTDKKSDVVEVPRSLLVDILTTLKEDLEIEGSCDHSVGICVCKLVSIIQRIDMILNPVGYAEVNNELS